MDIHVLPVEFSDEKDTLLKIRTRVFIEEQNVPKEIEWDGQDDDAHHFLAIDEAGRRIGCARLLPSGQIGRMAVLSDHSRKGIGFELLTAAIEEAKRLEFTRVFLHAQTHAEAFYRKAGFLPTGVEFIEAGIPHQAMELELPIPFEPQEPASIAIREQDADTRSAVSELLQYRGESECLEGLKQSLQWPHRTVRIYSQYLDHALFNSDDVTGSLSEFVRHGPPAHLQVLIHSSNRIVSRGHRLLELARRLQSKIEIRNVPTELAHDSHSCVVFDTDAYWLMPDHEDYLALANPYDPVQARRLADRFDYLWSRSKTDPELRILRV